jgi:hypothetical protein
MFLRKSLITSAESDGGAGMIPSSTPLFNNSLRRFNRLAARTLAPLSSGLATRLVGSFFPAEEDEDEYEDEEDDDDDEDLAFGSISWSCGPWKHSEHLPFLKDEVVYLSHGG